MSPKILYIPNKQAFFKQDADTLLSYKDILQDFPHIHFYVVWLFTCRCDFLLQNNFRFEPNIIYEDVLFTSYVFIFSESIYISNIPIYNYRISRENSIMNTKQKNIFIRAHIVILCYQKDFLNSVKTTMMR